MTESLLKLAFCAGMAAASGAIVYTWIGIWVCIRPKRASMDQMVDEIVKATIEGRSWGCSEEVSKWEPRPWAGDDVMANSEHLSLKHLREVAKDARAICVMRGIADRVGWNEQLDWIKAYDPGPKVVCRVTRSNLKGMDHRVGEVGEKGPEAYMP